MTDITDSVARTVARTFDVLNARIAALEARNQQLVGACKAAVEMLDHICNRVQDYRDFDITAGEHAQYKIIVAALAANKEGK
jgi:hypothetical protein